MCVCVCVCVCVRACVCVLLKEEAIPELEIDVDELLDMPSDLERAARVKVRHARTHVRTHTHTHTHTAAL